MTKSEELSSVAGDGQKTAAPSGLSPMVASVFITGMVAGSGMLALANAVRLTGWIGMVLLIYFGTNSAFCGYTLSRCWLLVESRYPELREHVRAPYPEIAYKAFGTPCKYLATVAIFINQFGSGVVYVLLSAELIRDLIKSAGFDMVECYWIIIIAVILCPCTFLGSPKDFQFIGVTALVSTMLAWLCIIIHLGSHYSETVPKATHESPTFGSLFLGMATILFAFGGASSFPTIQNDMADRTKFGYSVVFGYLGLICMYFPMTLLGYLALGDQLGPDLINSLYPSSFFRSAAQVLFMLNLTTSMVSVISPVYQQLEDSIGIPSEFNVRRVLFRTAMMVLNVLIGETVPSFGKILNLIGGSGLTLMTFILPPILYLKLTSMTSPEGKWEKIEVPTWEKILLVEIIVIATVGGTAATYSAIVDVLDPASFTSSCFISV